MKKPSPSLGAAPAVLVLLAGCGSTPPARAQVEPPKPPPPITGQATPPGPTVAAEDPPPAAVEGATVAPVAEDDPLGMVAGLPLRAEDLLLEWYQISPREMWLVVDKLVAVRLALAEAQRFGLSIGEAEITERCELEQRLLAQDVARERPGMTVDQFVAEVLGQDPASYARSLRRAAADQMLIERVVRCWVLSNENLTMRLIVVPAGDMETIETLLADGADFTELARVHSVDDSAEAGGLVPYIVRQEESALTRAAFETPVGEVGETLRSGEHELLFRVEARREPLPEAWADLRAAVLESLAAEPVTDAEFLHWKLALERQYPLDLRRLRALLGAAPPGRSQ